MVICDVCGEKIKDFDYKVFYSFKTRFINEACKSCFREMEIIKGKSEQKKKQSINELDEDYYKAYQREIENLVTSKKGEVDERT